MIMFDSITNAAYPADARACAAYVDGHLGNQPNYAQVRAEHPFAYVLSVALKPADDADCLDVERGAAAPGDFPGWHARQVARRVARPVVYASVDTMAGSMLPVLAAARIARPDVRLWSAHTGAGAHICGPRTCGAIRIDVDGTQWLSTGQVDQSLLTPEFFGPLPVGPAGLPKWQDQMMQALPVVSPGQRGAAVKTIQGLCNARLISMALVIDGIFGPTTLTAVKRVQALGRVTQDGTVGPETWPVLLGIAGVKLGPARARGARRRARARGARRRRRRVSLAVVGGRVTHVPDQPDHNADRRGGRSDCGEKRRKILRSPHT